ncbi:MAG: hypothetical protein HY815_00460 [Candidatus Riflebacteria bacterium]|nr:hypothetical protein [Candidatus Riflebacteria bacterium]
MRSDETLDSDAAFETCALLKWVSPRPEINLVLELYLREITGRLFRDVQTVYLFGSAVLRDLVPDTSDLNMVVLVKRDLGEAARGEIGTVHRYLASPAFAPWGSMLDVFYGPAGLFAAKPRPGKGLRGSSQGVRSSDKVQLDPMELYSLHDHGTVLHGADLRPSLRRPQLPELCRQVRLLTGRVADLDASAQPRDVIDGCADLTRALYVLEHERVASKSEATQWFMKLVKGKAADAALEANRLRRGEVRSGVATLRRLLPHFLVAAREELQRLEHRHGAVDER